VPEVDTVNTVKNTVARGGGDRAKEGNMIDKIGYDAHLFLTGFFVGCGTFAMIYILAVFVAEVMQQ
jgi:hypothetical protein